MYVCTCTCIYANKVTRQTTSVAIQLTVFTLVCVYFQHTDTCTCLWWLKYSVNIHVHTYKCTCTYMYVHIYTCTYIHTCIEIRESKL